MTHPKIRNSQLTRKDPDAGKDWRQKENEVAEKRWLDSITDSMGMNWSKFQEIVEDGQAWRAAGHEVTKSQTWLQWTD